MTDRQMFASAPEHVYIVAHHDWRGGWTLSVVAAAGEFHESMVESYASLSSEELLDVACARLAKALTTALEPN